MLRNFFHPHPQEHGESVSLMQTKTGARSPAKEDLGMSALSGSSNSANSNTTDTSTDSTAPPWWKACKTPGCKFIATWDSDSGCCCHGCKNKGRHGHRCEFKLQHKYTKSWHFNKLNANRETMNLEWNANWACIGCDTRNWTDRTGCRKCAAPSYLSIPFPDSSPTTMPASSTSANDYLPPTSMDEDKGGVNT